MQWKVINLAVGNSDNFPDLLTDKSTFPVSTGLVDILPLPPKDKTLNGLRRGEPQYQGDQKK